MYCISGVIDMLSEFPNYIVTFAPISIIPLHTNDIIIIIIIIFITIIIMLSLTRYYIVIT